MTIRTNIFDTYQTGFGCNCVGPQDGQPVCPCRMRNVRVRDGRYVEETDLGPAYPKQTEECLHEKFDRENPEERGKPRMLSCPCPKCSPRC